MAEALPGYALTTQARVKTRIGITGSGHDALLLRLIVAASDQIEKLCNRRFLKTTYAELHTFTRSVNQYIFTKQAPIVTLTSIEYRQGTVDDPQYTTIPTTDYIQEGDGSSGIITVDGGWLYRGVNVVRVNYEAGYLIDWSNFGASTHTLPADITELCERLVVRAFKRREAEGKDQESSSAPGGGSTKWLTALTEEDKDIINANRRNPQF